MSDFNAAQVLAEAYTLYKKHHDGMGLDFKIAINQVREESEQRGAERVEQAVLAVLDDYTMPGKLHDPTGIAGAELETLEGYIREAITDALKGDDDV